MQPMAKAPKRTTIADSKPLQSTADDWMPLIAAFLHIQQVVGGEQLAEEDLRLRLASGDVEAQDRRVTPGEGIDIIPLTPEDFKRRPVVPPPSRAHQRTCTARRIAATTCCAALTGSALMATISSCAALTCTAYGRSLGKQRSRGRRRCRATPPKDIGPKAWLAVKRSRSSRREGGTMDRSRRPAAKVRERLRR